MGVVIFAWKYGYSEIKSKKIGCQAAESRENAEKWRWRQTDLTKIMGTKFIVGPRLFYWFHNKNKIIPNISSKEREMNFA